MLLTKIEDDLAQGKPVDRREFTQLAYLAQSLTRTLLETQTARQAQFAVTHVPIDRSAFDRARQRARGAAAEQYYSRDIIDVPLLAAPEPDAPDAAGQDSTPIDHSVN